MGHWHVDTNNDEGPDIYPHVFAALDGARWHLDHEADYESQGASVAGEEGSDYDAETAVRCYRRADELGVLIANVENMTDHFYGRKPPAPLYQGEDALTLLVGSAKRVVDEINTSSRWIVGIFECSDQCGAAFCSSCDEEIVYDDMDDSGPQGHWTHVDDAEYDHSAIPADDDPDALAREYAANTKRDVTTDVQFGATSTRIPTATAGDLIDFLSQFDRSTPVTIDNQSWCSDHTELGVPAWLNISGAFLPNYGQEDEAPSILLVSANDFDTRQW